MVQQPAPVDSNIRDQFPELRTDSDLQDPLIDFQQEDEDDLFPDFSVNFEASADPVGVAAVRRRPSAPQSQQQQDLVPDFSVNIDLLDEDLDIRLDDNGNQVCNFSRELCTDMCCFIPFKYPLIFSYCL